MFRRAAIQGHRQDARDRRLADTAMSAEYIAVCCSSLLDTVFERTGDVILADNLGEFLGTVFTGENLITHEEYLRRLYVMRGGVIRPGNAQESLS
jgi:hypothetical protein